MKLANRSRTSIRSNRKIFSKLLGVRRLGVFEVLENRLTMSADSIDGRPYIDLGPSDNIALDQPKVIMELIQLSDSLSIGPDSIGQTFLLDTGANTILAFQTAVEDMNSAPPPYRTDGFFEEIGVGGSSLYDTSIPYRIDYAGVSGERNTIPVGRIISDDTRDLSQFGPWGITGMPAMTERVTTLNFAPLLTGYNNIEQIGMTTDFSQTLPTYNGPRYTVPVDNRISFSPDGSVVSGGPPVWAHLPFFTGQLKQDSNVSTGNFLLDTGAQVSIMSSAMAKELGLDSNLDGVLDNKDANFARDETIGGIGGLVTVPVFLVNQFHIQTSQGVDLVWTDLQWLVLDIIPGIDAIFGFDNLTSGWLEPFLGITTVPGYIMQSQLDFRNWKATNKGDFHLDLNPDIVAVVNPNGPGAIVTEIGGATTVAEGGANDTYSIALSKPPTANVRVNLVPALGNQVTAVSLANPSNKFVDFTPSNWNVPQTVLVTAVDDAATEGFSRSFVKNVPTSTDPQYQNVGMPRVIVNIIDNDYPGVMVIPTNGSTDVEEGGATDTYEVVLTYAPTEVVTIDIENKQNQVRAVATNGGGTSLNFTPANWSIPQRVTVTAVDDTQNEGPHKTAISHIINTSDPLYKDFAAALSENVFIKDNDQVDTIPPRILDVIVGSSAWNSSFIDRVDGGGIGSGNGLGISLAGKDQLLNLSQNGINKLYVRFSENVAASITPAKLSFKGTNTVNYMTGATTAYGVDGANVLTITLPTRVSKDAVVFSILDTLTDAAGNRLDGEWTDGQNGPSGNGSNNGQFNFRMDFLPGDVDNSNRVTAKDLQLAQGLLGKAVTSANRVYDVNGNGAIDNADLLLIERLMGSVLPSPPAAPSSRGSSSPKGSMTPESGKGSNLFKPQPFTVGRTSEGRLIDELLAKRQRLADFRINSELVGIGFDSLESNDLLMQKLDPFQVCLPVEASAIRKDQDVLPRDHVDELMQSIGVAYGPSLPEEAFQKRSDDNASLAKEISQSELSMSEGDLFQREVMDALINRMGPELSKKRRA